MVDKQQKEMEPLGWKERALRYCVYNTRQVLMVGLGGFLFCILAILYGTRDSGHQEMASQAKTTFDLWKKTPQDEHLTKEMQKALEKAPSLRRGLEAEIAQILLSEGQGQKAELMADRCLDRLNAESPLHAEFARISLSIEQKEYQKALEASVTLKERLEQAEARESLYGWNLVRIAFLHKLLHNPSGEKASWEEVKTLMQEESSAGKSLELGLGRPDFSLADFISLRERELAP